MANNAFKVYQASAGSGKTYTIVKEYLALCLKSPADTDNYSQILAITFTNMAANEMKDKILRQLDDIIHSDLSLEPKGMEADLIKELGIDRASLKANAELLFQKIIHDYSSFCVSTIDAFVQRLSRSFAKDLNLPTQFNVSIDEDEVADAITERIGEQIGTGNPFLTKILEDFSEMKFDNEKSPKIADSIHDFVKKLFSEEAFQKNEQNHFETEEQYKETLDFINKKIFHHGAFAAPEEFAEAAAGVFLFRLEAQQIGADFFRDPLRRVIRISLEGIVHDQGLHSHSLHSVQNVVGTSSLRTRRLPQRDVQRFVHCNCICEITVSHEGRIIQAV